MNHVVEEKLDAFLRWHVLPRFCPSRIRWWLSMSGGKDSFAMAKALARWYEAHGIRFVSQAFHIDQWGGAAAAVLQPQLSGFDLRVLDGRDYTALATRYKEGQQAPCRTCANVRRAITDAMLSHENALPGCVDFVARGLHLSDTAVSMMWRHVWGIDAVSEFECRNKDVPLVKLSDGTYLAKPLAYVREFETQDYAMQFGFRPACCRCPACRFPSRRDIVEESLIDIVRSGRWEFRVPGVRRLLEGRIGKPNLDWLISVSASDVEQKKRHLPKEFGEFAMRYFSSKVSPSSLRMVVDSRRDLDAIGLSRIMGSRPAVCDTGCPMPSTFVGKRDLTEATGRLIATLGPLWGAIGLADGMRKRVFRMQASMFGYAVDEKWSQVNHLLNIYYGSVRDASHAPPKELVVLGVPSGCSC